MSLNDRNGHFLTLYKMTLADDRVDPAEMEILFSIALEHGVKREDLVDLLMNPDRIESSFPDKVEEKLQLLFNMARVACADGKVTKEERACVAGFCLKFGFDGANIDAITEFVLEQATNGVSTEEFLGLVRNYI